jgi:hypothetical protein
MYSKALLAMGREWLASVGEISRFGGSVVRDVWGLWRGACSGRCGGSQPDRTSSTTRWIQAQLRLVELWAIDGGRRRLLSPGR